MTVTIITEGDEPTVEHVGFEDVPLRVVRQFADDGDPEAIAWLKDQDLRAAGFDEDAHPRDERGRFGEKGGDSADKDLPEGWKPIPEGEAIDADVDSMVASGFERSDALALAVAFRPHDIYAEYEGPNGMKVMFAGKSVEEATPAEQRRVMEVASDLQARFPREHFQIRVNTHLLEKLGSRVPKDSGGQTISGHPIITLNPRLFGDEMQEDIAESAKVGHLMPSAAGDPIEYAIAHEWGHTIDIFEQRSRATVGPAIVEFGEVPPSDYGQSHATEAYAESFAEWAVTRGETRDSFTRFIAEKEGWAT